MTRWVGMGWLWLVALGGCTNEVGMPGEGSVIEVMREGRDSERFEDVRFVCTSAEAAIDCVHGDPSIGNTGVELAAYFAAPFEDLPAGTVLAQEVDFQITTIAGGTDGSIWGAGGPSSWWAGDLTLELGERGTDGRAAVLEGTMETTEEVVDLIPITVSFESVEVTLP